MSCTDVSHQLLFDRSFVDNETLVGIATALRATDGIAAASRVDEQSLLLFVQPFTDGFHSGDCPTGCPRNDSVIVQRTQGRCIDPGDIYESPCFAFFGLKTTQELLAIVNWDYRN